MTVRDIIYCGDNVSVLREHVATESIDMVLTSPPYDDIRNYGGHDWDFCALAKEVTRVLKPGGAIVWIVGDTTKDGSESLSSFRQALYFKDECGLNVLDTMIYRKQNPGGARGSNRSYWQSFEYMFVMSKGRLKTFNPLNDRQNAKSGKTYTGGGGRLKNGEKKELKVYQPTPHGKRFNVWDVGNTSSDRTTHPAVFPLSLAVDHVLSWSNPGDTVLDPFMGSGTTMLACNETLRTCLGVEICEEYLVETFYRVPEHVVFGGTVPPALEAAMFERMMS